MARVAKSNDGCGGIGGASRGCERPRHSGGTGSASVGGSRSVINVCAAVSSSLDRSLGLVKAFERFLHVAQKSVALPVVEAPRERLHFADTGTPCTLC